MIARPCLSCGCVIGAGTHCTDCKPPDTKPDATTRGYDASWKRLSKRARRLQPFCSGCGSLDDLQCDHTPEAWARKAAGKSIRLQDVDVVCGRCNRSRGAARGNAVTRGDGVSVDAGHPMAKAQGAMKTTMIVDKGSSGALR